MKLKDLEGLNGSAIVHHLQLPESFVRKGTPLYESIHSISGMLKQLYGSYLVQGAHQQHAGMYAPGWLGQGSIQTPNQAWPAQQAQIAMNQAAQQISNQMANAEMWISNWASNFDPKQTKMLVDQIKSCSKLERAMIGIED